MPTRNLDIHSVPYYGEYPQVQRPFVSARSRAQPNVLAFLAQDASVFEQSISLAGATLRQLFVVSCS